MCSQSVKTYFRRSSGRRKIVLYRSSDRRLVNSHLAITQTERFIIAQSSLCP